MSSTLPESRGPCEPDREVPGTYVVCVADRREHYYILVQNGESGGPPVPRLLVVHHTTSPALAAMLEAVLAGAHAPGLAGIEVVISPALAASVPDALAADGFVLGTPANIGYMSGALKHFFDQVYYPCLHAKKTAPFGLYVHGASDTAGAVRAVKAITTGLGWTEVAKPVTATGPVATDVERQCYDLAATVAANLL